MSSEFKTLKGECLCGEVSWELSGPYEFFGMCQCSRCRKVTGAAFATNLFVKANQFKWLTGEKNVDEFVMQAPNTFGNAFCKKCGSRAPRLYHQKDGCWHHWEALWKSLKLSQHSFALKTIQTGLAVLKR